LLLREAPVDEDQVGRERSTLKQVGAQVLSVFVYIRLRQAKYYMGVCWIIGLGAVVTVVICFHCALEYKKRRERDNDTVATNEASDRDFEDVESPPKKVDESSCELTKIDEEATVGSSPGGRTEERK
jgi:hypothetical protein